MSVKPPSFPIESIIHPSYTRILCHGFYQKSERLLTQTASILLPEAKDKACLRRRSCAAREKWAVIWTASLAKTSLLALAQYHKAGFQKDVSWYWEPSDWLASGLNGAKRWCQIYLIYRGASLITSVKDDTEFNVLFLTNRDRCCSESLTMHITSGMLLLCIYLWLFKN